MKAAAVLITLALFGASFAANFAGKYEATYDGDKYDLTLEQKGNDLTGSAKAEGQTFRFTGTVSGDTATGNAVIESLGVKLYFKATRTPTGLRMVLAGLGADGKPEMEDADTIDFRRVGAEPEPEKKGPKLVEKYRKEPSAVLKEGKEYTHASGGKFRYPKDWELKEAEGFLTLTPPGAAADEAYIVVADSANGMTDPTSKQVVDLVEGQVRTLLPFVKRMGEVETTTSGAGKGGIVTWEGNNGQKLIQVRGFLTIMKGFAVALVAAGPKATIEKRDKQLREIFSTFGWGQGKRDTQLVGAWKHWSYSGNAGLSTERRASMRLNSDGTFAYEGSTETSGSATGRDSLGNVTWTGGMAGRNGNGWKGTWTADGANLFLHFEDGSTETFRYTWKREGANTFLVVTEPGGKPKEWSRA